ncbi:hypothetical protein B0T18DRAFT_417053 [Schizothecium vesticola]|uniref:Uncharacterized protein n=1 Tax=Schizothecium vesticola TaxID=314040 RepID=A0AA40EH65_9PEZI|nr:hypothetical protein B0T18DRAFT_417053 [Schizothecium vesticola]
MDTPAEPLPGYELSTFSHRHTILATGPVEADLSNSVLFELHHWHPPTLRKLTSASLPPSTLSGLKDSVSLGTFPVPVDVDIPQGFSGLLKGASPLTDRDVNLNPQTLANWVRELNDGSESEETQMQFFTFPILSNAPDPILSPTLFPVWKWIKPDSTYRRAGFWDGNLHKAIEDGEWNGGKNLTILIAGVSEKTRQTIASSEMGWKFSSLEQAEVVSERGG